MIRIERTKTFRLWLESLDDPRAIERISIRMARLQSGLFGNVKYFSGIGELKIDYGPGYRVYFLKDGNNYVLLLCAGDKSSQRRDIARALDLATEWKAERKGQ